MNHKNMQRAVWQRTTWNTHSTLPPELQAVKVRLLARSQILPTINAKAHALDIQHASRSAT